MSKINSAKKLAEKKGFKVILGSDLKPFEYIGMGLPQFDSLGGAVRGHYDVVWGPSGAAKSTALARRLAQAQQKFPTELGLLADSEDRAVASWFAAQGVDMSRLLILNDSCFEGVQGRATMEEYFDGIMTLVAEGTVSYAVMDSISAMVPKAMIETSAGVERSASEDQVAADARKTQQFIKMSKSLFAKTDTACSIICQVRTHGIGSAYTRDGFSGGNMLKHMASQIWHCERGPRSDWEFDEIKIEKYKSKLLKAFPVRWTLEKDTGPNESRQAFARFVVGTGFDDFQSHVRAGVRLGVIQETGPGRYLFITSSGAEQRFHGIDKLDPFFADETEFEHLKKKNLEAYTQQAPDEDLEKE